MYVPGCEVGKGPPLDTDTSVPSGCVTDPLQATTGGLVAGLHENVVAAVPFKENVAPLLGEAMLAVTLVLDVEPVVGPVAFGQSDKQLDELVELLQLDCPLVPPPGSPVTMQLRIVSTTLV